MMKEIKLTDIAENFGINIKESDFWSAEIDNTYNTLVFKVNED